MALSKKVSQGDIWLVDFDPTIGKETRKTRPAIVIDSEGFGYDEMRIVLPFSSIKNHRIELIDAALWLIRVDDYQSLGLDKWSFINAHQIKSCDLKRFKRKIGRANDELLFKVHKALVGIFNPRYLLKYPK